MKTCFMQRYDNKKHSIVYYLKKTSEIKQNYNIYDKKLFAFIKPFNNNNNIAKKYLNLTFI